MVRATFSDGTNVPRIPPVRLGGGVYWRDANWLARVRLIHAFAQNDIAPVGETTTPGYDDLRAELSYNWKAVKPRADQLSEFTIGINGSNLLNRDIRSSVSVLERSGADAGRRRAAVCQREVLIRSRTDCPARLSPRRRPWGAAWASAARLR